MGAIRDGEKGRKALTQVKVKAPAEQAQAWQAEAEAVAATAAEQGASEAKRRSCLHKQLRKTKFCMYHLQGVCQFGETCAFAHSCVELQGVPDLRKTRLCKAFVAGGCQERNCSFAHSEEELRSTNLFYKKSLCIWYEKGRCRNGDQCRFAHGLSELRSQVMQPGEKTLPGDADVQDVAAKGDASLQAAVAKGAGNHRAGKLGGQSSRKTTTLSRKSSSGGSAFVGGGDGNGGSGGSGSNNAFMPLDDLTASTIAGASRTAPSGLQNAGMSLSSCLTYQLQTTGSQPGSCHTPTATSADSERAVSDKSLLEPMFVQTVPAFNAPTHQVLQEEVHHWSHQQQQMGQLQPASMETTGLDSEFLRYYTRQIEQLQQASAAAEKVKGRMESSQSTVLQTDLEKLMNNIVKLSMQLNRFEMQMHHAKQSALQSTTSDSQALLQQASMLMSQHLPLWQQEAQASNAFSGVSPATIPYLPEAFVGVPLPQVG